MVHWRVARGFPQWAILLNDPAFPATHVDSMRLLRKNNLLVEPPSSATGDIAFNLIVFFLVCASVQPDSGRHQTLPRA